MHTAKTRVLLPALAILALATASAGQEPAKKVSEAEATSAAISKVAPVYPSTARQLKIEGQVELDVFIGLEGSVEDVKIVSGNPILTKPAADAFRKWKFRPFAEDGKPIRVMAHFTVTFKL